MLHAFIKYYIPSHLGMNSKYYVKTISLKKNLTRVFDRRQDKRYENALIHLL